MTEPLQIDDWTALTLAQLSQLDEDTLRTVPVSEIPKACKRLETFRVTGKNLMEDADAALRQLNNRVQDEVLKDMKKAEYPEGVFTKSESDFMKLPEGGWPAVFTECIRRVTEDDVPVDEAFSWINHHRLNPKPFIETPEDDLPIGLGRFTKTYTKFKPSK